MDVVRNLVNLVPGHDWTALLGWLAAGGGISVVLQVIKHFKGINSAAIARTILVFLSTVTGLAAFILTSPGLQLIPSIAKYTALLIAVAHFWYWLTVSPVYKWFTRLLQDAEQLKTLTIGQPVSSAEPPLKQFEE